MAILLEPGMPILVQYPASRYASGMVASMCAAGTCVVAGVAPGRGGEIHDGTRWFDTVAEAVTATGAAGCVCFAAPPQVHDAIVEAADSRLRLLVVVAEYVPVHDAIPALAYARARDLWVIGPNCLGLLSPGIGVLGGLSPALGRPGRVGVLSRSGTLALVITDALSRAGIGQSTVVTTGGDAVIGRSPAEYVRLFADDPDTDLIVLLGEIGGAKEYEVADLLPTLGKKLVALIVGRHAREGSRFGHAGALVMEAAETAAAKESALAAAGALIARGPGDLVRVIRDALG